MRRCSRCILPDTVPGVEFDAQGVCSVCRSYKPPLLQGRAALDKIIDAARGKGDKYDCVVPVSGGRDSTYVLYLARTAFNLRVLAVNYDHEFRDPEVRANIERACERLKVDVEFVRSHNDIATRMVRTALKVPSNTVGWNFCGACAYGYHSAPYRAALRHQTPLILWGQATAEDVSGALDRTSSTEPKWSRIRRLLRPHYLLGEWLALQQRMQFPVRGNSVFRRRLPVLHDPDIQQVRVFDFIPWDRRAIKDTIMNELGWRKPADAISTWKADCSIHALGDYRFIRRFGCSRDGMAYSNMINAGSMTRQEALEQEEQKLALYTDEFARRQLIETVGLTAKEAERALRLDSAMFAPRPPATPQP